MPRALIAPDSFKGTMAATDVAAALAHGFEAAGWTADRCPLGDGGEGTASVLVAALGGERRSGRAVDPLGRDIDAAWYLLGDGETAVVEAAEASGLGRVGPSERDPVAASTAGTGTLIAAAAQAASTVLVGVGGTATTDGGRGAIDAIRAAGGLGDARMVCLCDVSTPWELAAATFASQKGADRHEVDELDRRLAQLAGEVTRDPRGLLGGGAGGGLAGGLWAELGAELRPGASYVADTVGLDARIGRADLAVGGEGRLDATTLEGKVLAELAARCAAQRVTIDAVVGEDRSDAALRKALGVRSVHEASDAAELERAGAALASA